MHNFTHLEVHSHYTLLGGTASVTALAERAAAEGLRYLALTDTNGLYGAVAFDRACREAGVQPILGMTVTVAPAPEEMPRQREGPGRLVLLARGPDGYRSLCKLSSLVQGSPERERVAAQGLSWEGLKAYRRGLICLSGGRRGWVERALRAGDLAAAQRYAGHLAGIYGENAYLSVELHGPQDVDIGYDVLALSLRLGMPVVAVQPVYYLAPGEAEQLRLLAAIDHNCRLDQHPAAVTPGDDLHWLSPDEVALRFSEFPQAVAAASDVALRCEPALPERRPIWPALNLPQGQTADDALAQLAEAGLAERYGQAPAGALERLAVELAIIAQHGYAPLFLVVADITRFAREAQVPVSTRGSVANSLVAYCTGITGVDPLAHDLLFERFLSPERTDPPDIDLDFCSRRRDKVLEYVRERYGTEHVALVGAMSTLQPRSALRETAKAYGLDDGETRELMEALPSEAVSRRSARSGADLTSAAESLGDPRRRQVVWAAASLVGQPHHLSLHPGAVVITPGPLTDVAPVQWAPKGFLMTQFDHKDLEALGLPKIDLLGNRALTVLRHTAELVRRHHDPAFRLAEIPLEDERTGNTVSYGETIGVFQCESTGARRTLRKLKARTIRDLAVANAFFKPGPATGGMAGSFVRRYRGEEPVSYLHPSLAPILGPTKGVLLFQEQILRVAREIAGLSWAEADRLRRGMNFRPDEMARVRQRFVEGCQNPSAGSGQVPSAGSGQSLDADDQALTAEQAERLWEQVAAFAGYGFNQGHATAYADISYRSAYLKTHWPGAFLCARLADRGGFHHPAIYLAEAVRLGIAVRPPHVNHSGRRFALEVRARETANADARPTPTLWMGLGQVRDLRRSTIEGIVAERKTRPFADLRDLLRRVPLYAKEVRHLIQCGGLDGLGQNRAALLAEAEEIRWAGSASQLAFPFAHPQVPAESPAQRAAWERYVLGQPLSVHPLALVIERLPAHAPLRQLPDWPISQVTVAGVRLPGWTGGRGFFLGDGETFIEVVWEAAAPAAWNPLLVHGRWEGDDWGTFWLEAERIERVEG